MSEEFKRPTFLSDYVHLILVDLPLKGVERRDNCIVNLQFDWNEINSAFGNIAETDNILSMERSWFLKKIEVFWGILESTGHKLRNCESELEYSWILSYWLGDEFNVKEIYLTSFKSPLGPLEATLKLLPILERALGNVYLIKGKTVPFLLRDLLASNELCEILGKTPVVFMQLFFGCVLGLNIRNIAWHGFLSPEELHPNLLAGLVVLIISLGKILCETKIPSRPLLTLESEQPLFENCFPDIQNFHNEFEELIINSRHIHQNHRPCWARAYQLYSQDCYGDSLLVLLPVFEHFLRSVFCYVNKSHPRMLTAEHSAFYTTLDDILDSNDDNKTQEILGENVMVMLLDIFSYPAGPKLRDRISHGEVDLRCITKVMTNHVFCTALGVIRETLISEGTDLKPKGLSILVLIDNSYLHYTPKFHPKSILKRSMVTALNKITNWNEFPQDKAFSSVPCKVELEKVECLRKEIEGSIMPYLFRPKQEMELILSLQRIVSVIIEICDKVADNMNTRYQLWMDKKLRSRGRQNYFKMLNTLPILQNTLVLIIFLTLNILITASNLNFNEMTNSMRFFKFCLQYVENVSSMSSIEKNRWDEIKSWTEILNKDETILYILKECNKNCL